MESECTVERCAVALEIIATAKDQLGLRFGADLEPKQRKMVRGTDEVYCSTLKELVCR